jgi:hypothetical protein
VDRPSRSAGSSRKFATALARSWRVSSVSSSPATFHSDLGQGPETGAAAPSTGAG